MIKEAQQMLDDGYSNRERIEIFFEVGKANFTAAKKFYDQILKYINS